MSTRILNFVIASFLFTFVLVTGLAQAVQVELTWNAPTSNADGSVPLTDLGWYRLHYRQAASSAFNQLDLGNTTSQLLCTSDSSAPSCPAVLEAGKTYDFAISALDTSGNESALSSIVSLTVPALNDSDGDGLSDDEEATLGTDPNNPDSDGDGLSDGEEVNTYGTDPLVADADVVIPQTQFTLVSVDSEELVGENGDGENAFDGAPLTHWVTQWSGGSPAHPHELVIDLNGDYLISGFRYLPRQDGGVNGTVADYSFSVSDDGATWSEVSSGTFAANLNEKEVRFPATPGRFIRFVALSEINGQPWTTMAELNVLGTVAEAIDSDGDGLSDDEEATLGTDPNNADSDGDGLSDGAEVNTHGTDPNNPDSDGDGLSDGEEVNTYGTDPLVADADVVIPQTQFTLVSVDSEELVGENGDGENAFDGAPLTHWVTQWSGGSPAHPHELVIDLNGDYLISGFRYLPRQDGGVNGTVADYSFSVSDDGATWSEVSSGTFAANLNEKEVRFPATPGRFIRFVALSEINGQPWTTMAELNVLGTVAEAIDSDGDGLSDDEEATLGTDPNNADSDGDGLSDGAEVNTHGTDPNNPDSDGDGLSDGEEVNTYGTDPLVADADVVIPQTQFTLVSVDSEELVGENGDGENAFDGAPLTHWVTQWSGGSPAHPHELVIDLNGDYLISGFRYLPRQDGGVNGTVADYSFSVSDDGATWSEVSSGTFAANLNEKEVRFPATPGRFIRFVALSEIKGKPWTTVAELNVLGTSLAVEP